MRKICGPTRSRQSETNPTSIRTEWEMTCDLDAPDFPTSSCCWISFVETELAREQQKSPNSSDPRQGFVSRDLATPVTGLLQHIQPYFCNSFNRDHGTHQAVHLQHIHPGFRNRLHPRFRNESDRETASRSSRRPEGRPSAPRGAAVRAGNPAQRAAQPPGEKRRLTKNVRPRAASRSSTGASSRAELTEGWRSPTLRTPPVNVSPRKPSASSHPMTTS